MKRQRRRNTFFIAIVALIIFVVTISNWRAVWSAGISARQAREARSRVLDSRTNADMDIRAPSAGRSMPALQAAPVLQALATFPLAFEANQGQADQRTRFLAREAGGELHLNEDSVALRFMRSALSFHFDGAHCTPRVIGEEPVLERRNFLLGSDRSKWHTDVPTFRRVAYRQLYPGIDLTFYGNQKQIEYDFEVAPGADPRAIRLAFDRNLQPRISADGDLILKSKGLVLIQRKPVIYQTIDGDHHTIEGRYKLLGDRKIGLEVAEYDHTKPLVIDPTLVYSTYLGGSADDSGNSITTDSSGNVYVTGTTASTNFPTHTPAFATSKGLEDIFVSKIDAAGANVLYSTYVGGSGRDRAGAIAIDSSGNAYLVGRVDSTSTNFPTTPGSLATSYRGGDFDGIVFKLNAQGDTLVYSSFLGGEENDSVEGINVDAGGVAYVTSGTKSNGFPITINAYQSTRAGDTDAFLAKINAAGSALLYSSFIGGAATDRGSGVVIDGSGIAYVAGYGASPDFPTENPFQAGFGGSFDAFVAKFDTNAGGINSLVFSSYLGGSGDDKAFGIAIDAAQANLYLVGQTSSNNFPVLNPVQPSSGGSFDAFLAKVSTTGSKVFATYFGGSGDDRGTGIAVNSSGVYMTGFTSSTNLPTVTPLQLNNGGAFDAFVAKLNLAGSSTLYSTYVGGSANENFVAAVTGTNPIAVDSSNAFITGYSSSTNFPTASPLQSANAGNQDAFIAKNADATPAADFALSASPASRTINPGDATTYIVTATPAGGFNGDVSLSISGASSDMTPVFNPTQISITDASAKSSTLTVTTTASTPPGTHTLTVTATSGNVQHTTSVQLIVSGPTSANLSLTKTASPNPGVTLANLTYRLTVTNNGPSPATNVVVTDNLPIGINFTSATPTQGMCSGTTTVTCNLGSLARNAMAVINIIVVPQSAGTLTNTASVAGTENDPDGSDNSVSLQTTISSPASGPSLTDPK